jgi:hypothetical protein
MLVFHDPGGLLKQECNSMFVLIIFPSALINIYIPMDVFKEPSLFSFGENFLDPVKVTVCEEQ